MHFPSRDRKSESHLDDSVEYSAFCNGTLPRLGRPLKCPRTVEHRPSLEVMTLLILLWTQGVSAGEVRSMAFISTRR